MTPPPGCVPAPLGEVLLALEDRRAAEHLAALEHTHAQAGAREIGGGGEPVVACSDDDRVVG